MKASTNDIQKFCEALTRVTNENFRKRGDLINSAQFVTSPGGKKYIRVVQESYVHGHHCSTSAHCFVKIEDGTLWKPGGWKGPKLNFPRGSVFDTPETPYAGRE